MIVYSQFKKKFCTCKEKNPWSLIWRIFFSLKFAEIYYEKNKMYVSNYKIPIQMLKYNRTQTRKHRSFLLDWKFLFVFCFVFVNEFIMTTLQNCFDDIWIKCLCFLPRNCKISNGISFNRWLSWLIYFLFGLWFIKSPNQLGIQKKKLLYLLLKYLVITVKM